MGVTALSFFTFLTFPNATQQKDFLKPTPDSNSTPSIYPRSDPKHKFAQLGGKMTFYFYL
jgi:hypothetical protein